jgi:hypothetical protein
MGNEIPLFLTILIRMGFSGNVIPLFSLITANWLSEHYNKGMTFPLHATSTPTHEIVIMNETDILVLIP